MPSVCHSGSHPGNKLPGYFQVSLRDNLVPKPQFGNALAGKAPALRDEKLGLLSQGRYEAGAS